MDVMVVLVVTAAAGLWWWWWGAAAAAAGRASFPSQTSAPTHLEDFRRFRPTHPSVSGQVCQAAVQRAIDAVDFVGGREVPAQHTPSLLQVGRSCHLLVASGHCNQRQRA